MHSCSYTSQIKQNLKKLSSKKPVEVFRRQEVTNKLIIVPYRGFIFFMEFI